ncbi:MAG: copper oxidase [Desulfobulbus propionicus]|nr:MAG: copper oxidase [Desulfobulbus propionicus]
MQCTATDLTYHTSRLLSVPHGMFCRHGGHSPAPYNSLNFSYHTGDNEENITANRDMARKILNLFRLYSAQQVHADKIAIISEDREEQELSGYDALITNQPGAGLLIQQADCQAVLLYDYEKRVIAAIHNGWKGSVVNIIGKTISCLQKHFQVKPENLIAVISPSLGPCCAEFIHYKEELPVWMHRYQVQKNYFDFWTISRIQLIKAGVTLGRIDSAGLCTQCSHDFFSYRRSRMQGKETGRNGSIIGLPPS